MLLTKFLLTFFPKLKRKKIRTNRMIGNLDIILQYTTKRRTLREQLVAKTSATPPEIIKERT